MKRVARIAVLVLVAGVVTLPIGWIRAANAEGATGSVPSWTLAAALAFGAIVGLLVSLAAGWIDRRERTGRELDFGTIEIVGVVIALLPAVALIFIAEPALSGMIATLGGGAGVGAAVGLYVWMSRGRQDGSVGSLPG